MGSEERRNSTPGDSLGRRLKQLKLHRWVSQRRWGVLTFVGSPAWIVKMQKRWGEDGAR